ncbi:MAG: hypothetical protein DME86_08830, partial [Verrucomicrobia bacterium]
RINRLESLVFEVALTFDRRGALIWVFCHVERSRDISHYFPRNSKRFLDSARNDRRIELDLSKTVHL